METITIKEINRYNKTSASTGKPFVSVAIKTTDGRSVSGFGNKDNQNWNAGDAVEIEIEQKGQYLNFTMPKTHQTVATGFQPSGDLLRVERKLDAIMTEIQMIRGLMQGTVKETAAGHEFPDSDLPF